MKKTITQAMADSFKSAVMDRFHARVGEPGDNKVRTIIGTLLGLLKITDAARWMAEFSFTLACFVFLAPNLDPRQTVFVLAHECQHVYQWWQKHVMFVVIYVQAEGRAALEAEAYTTTGECFWIFGGAKAIPAPELLARSIPVAYALNDAESKWVFKSLEQSLSAIPDVGPTTAVGRWTWGWFVENHPDMVHPEALALWASQNPGAAPKTGPAMAEPLTMGPKANEAASIPTLDGDLT